MLPVPVWRVNTKLHANSYKEELVNIAHDLSNMDLQIGVESKPI